MVPMATFVGTVPAADVEVGDSVDVSGGMLKGVVGIGTLMLVIIAGPKTQ
jgi:hypothetical protein